MERLLFKGEGEILYCMNDWSNSEGGLCFVELLLLLLLLLLFTFMQSIYNYKPDTNHVSGYILSEVFCGYNLAINIPLCWLN